VEAIGVDGGVCVVQSLRPCSQQASLWLGDVRLGMHAY